MTVPIGPCEVGGFEVQPNEPHYADDGYNHHTTRSELVVFNQGTAHIVEAYKLPRRKTLDRRNFRLFETCRFHTSGMGRINIITSVMVFGIAVPYPYFESFTPQ